MRFILACAVALAAMTGVVSMAFEVIPGHVLIRTVGALALGVLVMWVLVPALALWVEAGDEH